MTRRGLFGLLLAPLVARLVPVVHRDVKPANVKPYDTEDPLYREMVERMQFRFLTTADRAALDARYEATRKHHEPGPKWEGLAHA